VIRSYRRSTTRRWRGGAVLIIVLEFRQQAAHTRMRSLVRHGVVERRGIEARRVRSVTHRPDNAYHNTGGISTRGFDVMISILVGLCEEARWQRDLKRRLEEEGAGGRDINRLRGS
jgi:hypothetical protein